MEGEVSKYKPCLRSAMEERMSLVSNIGPNMELCIQDECQLPVWFAQGHSVQTQKIFSSCSDSAMR